MAEKLSEDYANYFKSSDVAKEVTPLLSTAENISTRLTEIENVFLPTISHDIEEISENVSQILELKNQFDEFCSQIDNLEQLVERVKCDMAKVEKQVAIADEELDIPEKKLDIVLKTLNFFAKPRDPRETNCNSNGDYQAPEIFSSKDYFSNENL